MLPCDVFISLGVGNVGIKEHIMRVYDPRKKNNKRCKEVLGATKEEIYDLNKMHPDDHTLSRLAFG